MKRFFFVLLLASLALILSACSGGYTTSSWPGAAADETTAYVAFNQHVYAINLETGAEKWRYPQKADAAISFYAAPVLSPDGQLIVGDYGHTLYSLDPQTGTENWKFVDAKHRYVASPLATSKGIFAPVADGSLYALNLNGKPMWAKPFKAKGPIWAQPTADNECNCIYAASMDHHIYAINADTGEQEWVSEKLGGSVAGTPIFDTSGKLFVGTFGKQMVALDLQNGKIIGQPYTTDAWVWSGPVLSEGRLYFGDTSGSLYILYAGDLSEVKKLSLGEPVVATPLVFSDTLVVPTEAGSLQAMDLNGAPRWKVTLTKGKFYGPPIRAGDLILVAPTENDAILIAYNSNGLEMWKFIPAK